MQYQLDIRVGCIAIYKGEMRNCLSGISEDKDCLFYHHGKWNDKTKQWEIDKTFIDMAKRLHHELTQRGKS